MAMKLKTRVEPGFRLVMPSLAENVAVVRQAVGGVVDVLELEESRLLDINAAVSEACNNVVIHAYDGREGPMRVQLQIEPNQLEVTVSDDGVGIRPGPPDEELEIQGLGLSVIQTLTDRTEFLGGVSQGTEVRMAFALDARPSTATHETAASEVEVDQPPGEFRIAVSAGPLAAPVLGRVIASRLPPERARSFAAISVRRPVESMNSTWRMSSTSVPRALRSMAASSCSSRSVLAMSSSPASTTLVCPSSCWTAISSD